MLATAATLFVTTAAAALGNLDMCTVGVHRTDHGADRARFALHHQRRSGAVSSKGRSLPATASRARKMRERTVPIGQFMMPAISS